MNALTKRSDKHAMSRRLFCSILATSSFVSLTQAGSAMANSNIPPSDLTLEGSLQLALHTIGSVACIAAADKLSGRPFAPGKLALHLRNADITADGALRIAGALGSVSEAELVKLGSFSLSYNEISDDGAIALAAVLPNTLGELGLVGCSISDLGANALLKWTKNASGLRMICIEDNNVSADVRNSFRQLRETSPSLSVYV
jgi:hypothetical protein